MCDTFFGVPRWLGKAICQSNLPAVLYHISGRLVPGVAHSIISQPITLKYMAYPSNFCLGPKYIKVSSALIHFQSSGTFTLSTTSHCQYFLFNPNILQLYFILRTNAIS